MAKKWLFRRDYSQFSTEEPSDIKRNYILFMINLAVSIPVNHFGLYFFLAIITSIPKTKNEIIEINQILIVVFVHAFRRKVSHRTKVFIKTHSLFVFF